MIIAVDTGGTHTRIARFSDEGFLLQSTKFPTPKPIDEYVTLVTENIRLVAAGEPISVISMALPGVIRDGVAEWCVNLGWEHVPMRELIAQQFPNATILVDNDANLAGLASMRRLNPIPRCGLYITIGTGIGTALVLEGELHDARADLLNQVQQMRRNNDGRALSASGALIQGLRNRLFLKYAGIDYEFYNVYDMRYRGGP